MSTCSASAPSRKSWPSERCRCATTMSVCLKVRHGTCGGGGTDGGQAWCGVVWCGVVLGGTCTQVHVYACVSTCAKAGGMKLEQLTFVLVGASLYVVGE